jgi:hypothetical protein
LKEEVWIRDENDSDDVNLNTGLNNINDMRVERTPRFKFYKDMQTCEIEYFKRLNNSLGDVNKIVEIHNTRAKEEIKIQKSAFDIPNSIYNELYDKLITEPNNISKQRAKTIRFNDNVPAII